MREKVPDDKVDFSGITNFDGPPWEFTRLAIMSNHVHCDRIYEEHEKVRRYFRWIVIATLLAAGISLGWSKKEQIMAKVNPIFPQTAHVAEKQAQPQAERYLVP